jgi:hypothetical protein
MLDQNHQDQIVAKFDISWAVARWHDAINQIEYEVLRPFHLIKPKITLDGNMYCCLYGDNLHEGIAGFGKSPDDAGRAFDKAWVKEIENG